MIRVLLLLFLIVGGVGAAFFLMQARQQATLDEVAEGTEEAAGESAALPARSGGREAIGVRPLQPVAEGGIDARWVKLNRRAIEALDAGEIERAIACFEECLAAEPGQQTFKSNLAEALARSAARDFELGTDELRAEAIAALERALELDPGRDDIARSLERMRRVAVAEEDFWRDETEHFQLAYDGSRDEILRGSFVLTQELESAYLDFGELFGHFPVEDGRPKIRVVLYRREEFGALTGLGDWAAGAFDGTVRVPVGDLDRERAGLKRVLRHELVHAFVRESGGKSVPGWLNEGLAQWLEWVFPDERRRAVERARGRLEGHALFPLERMSGTLAAWKKTDEIRRAYAQSLVLVAAIEHSFGERVLFDMIRGCARGETCEATLARRTGAELGSVLTR